MRSDFSLNNRQPPSGQSRVYPVTQLRTDGIHCREAAGARPVVLKAVSVTGAAFSGITMEYFLCASLFPHPLYGAVWCSSGHVN